MEKFRAVVAGEAEDAKRERGPYRFQNGKPVAFGNGFHRADPLPRCHGIDGRDVIETGLTLRMTLVHGIDPPITGLAWGVWLAPFGDRDLPCLGVVHRDPLPPVGRRAAQIVDVRGGDLRQPPALCFAEDPIFPLQDVPQGRPGQPFLRRSDSGQQGDVWAGVAAGKAMPADGSDLDWPSLDPRADQPGELRARLRPVSWPQNRPTIPCAPLPSRLYCRASQTRRLKS